MAKKRHNLDAAQIRTLTSAIQKLGTKDLSEMMGLDTTVYLAYAMVVPVALLRKAPWNYKKGDEMMEAALAANIASTGQIINCCIRRLRDGTYEICDGNHRRDVFRINEQENAFCVDLRQRKNGKAITIAQAKRTAGEVNETRFDTDPLLFGQLLFDIRKVFTLEELARTMPYSEDQLSTYVELVDYDFSAEVAAPTSKVPEGWTQLNLTFPDEDFTQVNLAIERMVEQGATLDNRRSVKYGQVFSRLAGHFLRTAASRTTATA